MLAKYLSWTEANDIDLAFNLLGGANYDALRDLRNASKMIDFATNDELKNSYTALSHFVRVFFFFNLTMQVVISRNSSVANIADVTLLVESGFVFTLSKSSHPIIPNKTSPHINIF